MLKKNPENQIVINNILKYFYKELSLQNQGEFALKINMRF